MRQYDPKRGLYRSRNGMILGVCKGVADHLDFPVFWLRVIAVVLAFGSFTLVIWIYLAAAIFMKPEPVVPFRTEMDREFYDSYASSRTLALHRLRDTYAKLDRRIRRMESIVTSRDFNWEKRMGE
ncbi:envelope stress response membrane protein PspC [Candidatus Sumerlaeota bacterium]|nr:envelope stress response membrane protein PspC [Candidatus Sumerlaeota bacterium]